MNERADIIFMKEMDYFKICKSNYRAGCANLIANAFGKLGQYLQSTEPHSTNTISFCTDGKIYTWDFFLISAVLSFCLIKKC